MGKALYGFHGGPDARMLAELATLRARVRQLEAELAQLRSTLDVPLEDDIDLELLTTQDAALV